MHIIFKGNILTFHIKFNLKCETFLSRKTIFLQREMIHCEHNIRVNSSGD